MSEIVAYYNGLPSVKPVKKFESREVAVTRIWAVLKPRQAPGGADTQGGPQEGHVGAETTQHFEA
jgi:hypothetical protein